MRFVNAPFRFAPAQRYGGDTFFVWLYVDRLLKELLGLE
jgi:hypothetical protein